MEPVNRIASSRALGYKRQNSRNPGQSAAEAFEYLLEKSKENRKAQEEMYYMETKTNQYNNNGILIFYTPQPTMDFRR